MPPRTRRLAAVAAAALVADMQLDSDVDVDEDEDLEDDEILDEDGDGEEEEMEEEQLMEDEYPPPAAVPQTKLKITLKLPVNTASSNSVGASTPDDAEMDYAAFKRTPRRRAKAKVIHDNDIESEDPMSQSASEEEPSTRAGPSRSMELPSANARPLTTRQAVLASMVDPTHVSLNESSRSKKQPLNETELALRREETARKRKNLSEKRLEDEKAETINRLLKKQSRPKNKRTNTTESHVPSGVPTPKAKLKTGEEGEEGDAEEDEDEVMEPVAPPEEVKPSMYRWVSSFHQAPGKDEQMQMIITFSVPESVYPGVAIPKEDKSTEMTPELERIRQARRPGVCAIEGCGKPRKYRLPKDWTIGACGSDHLRMVAGRS